MKKFLSSTFIYIIAILLFNMVGCKEDESVIIDTLPVTKIKGSIARSGGKILEDGGGKITSRGVVWGKSENPTLDDNIAYTYNGYGIGEFVSEISGFRSLTNYYVRAYAVNEMGVTYGQAETFITGNTGAGVNDIDGNFYPSVVIGNQEWMARNLHVTRDANGKPIDFSCYQPHAPNCSIYGGFYSWHTIMNGAPSSSTNPSNVQGICPTGWHVPSDAEWTELVDYLGSQGFPNRNELLGAGNALKGCQQKSSQLGGDCATDEKPRWNSNNIHFGFNEFGFSAMPAEASIMNGGFNGYGVYAGWWTSTENIIPGNDSDFAWNRKMSNYTGDITHNPYGTKTWPLSIRCVRDK